MKISLPGLFFLGEERKNGKAGKPGMVAYALFM